MLQILQDLYYNIFLNQLLDKDILNQGKKALHSFENFKVVRIKFKSLNELNSIENVQPGFGVFAETNISKIDSLNNLLSSRSQTMTYFGYDKKKIKNIILDNRFKGIDRVVQFGNAFNMSHIWDGFDIVNTLSREISLQ